MPQFEVFWHPADREHDHELATTKQTLSLKNSISLLGKKRTGVSIFAMVRLLDGFILERKS
jgi:hypothetical protein